MTTIMDEIEAPDLDVPKQPTPAKKFRVQLDFEAADMETINLLVEELKLGTRAELFRSGLRAVRWMVNKKKLGCAVVAMAPDEDRLFEPEFEFLDAIPAPPPRSGLVEKEQEREPALV